MNWEDSVARTLQGLEDGSPKKVSTRKPKISANVNVTVKGRTIYGVLYQIVTSFSDQFSQRNHIQFPGHRMSEALAQREQNCIQRLM